MVVAFKNSTRSTNLKRKVLFFIAIAFALTTSCSQNNQGPVEIGKLSPDFHLADLDGAKINLKKYKGKPLIINFWATWCQPCMKEIPVLKDVSDHIDIVGIALDKGGEKPVKRFVKANNIPYKVLLGNEEIFRKFNGYSIPYTVVLDASHRVVNIHHGVAGKEDLEQDIQKL